MVSINTVALFILLGILFEMFSLEATRISLVNNKTAPVVLSTIIGTTALYVLFLTTGWFVGKFCLKGTALHMNRIVDGALLLLIAGHTIVRDRRKVSAAALLYQNNTFYFSIALAKSITHIISGVIFYNMDLFTHVFFNWILISTTVFSIISVTLTYPKMRIFGFSVDHLKVVLYGVAFVLLFFV